MDRVLDRGRGLGRSRDPAAPGLDRGPDRPGWLCRRISEYCPGDDHAGSNAALGKTLPGRALRHVPQTLPGTNGEMMKQLASALAESKRDERFEKKRPLGEKP